MAPKKPRPTTVEKIQAKQTAPPAPPSLTLPQVNNLAFAARRALAGLAGADLQVVSAAIAQAETVLEFHRRQAVAAQPPAPTAPPAPPAPPASPAPAAKG